MKKGKTIFPHYYASQKVEIKRKYKMKFQSTINKIINNKNKHTVVGNDESKLEGKKKVEKQRLGY